MRVLIVEDKVKMAGQLRRALRGEGMSADVAITGGARSSPADRRPRAGDRRDRRDPPTPPARCRGACRGSQGQRGHPERGGRRGRGRPPARVPIHAQDQRLVAVVGQSLEERDQAIAGLTNVLLLGGPLALVLASLAGSRTTCCC